MPNRECRRKDDPLIQEIYAGVHMLLGVFDIDPANKEKANEAAREANKDFRFLRATRLGAQRSARQMIGLTITGVAAWLTSLFMRHH